MNLNKVFLLGNLTRDPELRQLPSGQSVVSFGLATNRFWKDTQGQRQQKAEFHNIVLFGRLAEVAHQYLRKGSLAFIEGRIQTRSWDDKEGNKRYRTEVVAESLQLGPRTASVANSKPLGSETNEDIQTVEYPEDDIKPEEIPF